MNTCGRQVATVHNRIILFLRIVVLSTADGESLSETRWQIKCLRIHLSSFVEIYFVASLTLLDPHPVCTPSLRYWLKYQVGEAILVASQVHRTIFKSGQLLQEGEESSHGSRV